MKRTIVSLLIAVFSLTPVFAQVGPPVAKIVPKADTLHGDIRVDNYAWLRDVSRTNPEVVHYLEAENAFTDAVMKPTEALQETLYNEMVRRIKETDEDPPYREGNYWYYTRTEKGMQYPKYCRKKENLTAPEQIYLDPNELAKGRKFYRVWAMDLSTDGNMLAFSVDTNGSENYILMFKNLTDGTILDDRVQNTQSITWAADNKSLFYTVEDTAKRPYRIYRHTVGTSPASDKLIFEEGDGLYTVDVGRSRSDAYVYVSSHAFNADEVRYIPANHTDQEPVVIIPRKTGHEYSVDDWGSYFYIRTNNGAPAFRLMRAPVGKVSESTWQEVLPARKGITLEGTDFFANYRIDYEREKGLQKMRVTDMKSGAAHSIDFPDPVYSAFPNVNRVYNTGTFRFSYQSLTSPPSIFDYDMASKDRKLIKQQEVLGGYDPSKYTSERIFAKAPDGTDVPISLVYKKGTPLDGTSPLHLTGYGSYGSPSQPTFSSVRLSYLDRGVIFAIAHVRGGGDMGREWYDDGKLMHKKNTFTDFIACAEHLVKMKYTNPSKLTISGGSAGGLLMGAVTNMRPDLFKAVVASVPFVDVINTMLDPTLMYTAQEYLEWGNPNEKPAYEYMKTYCPYTNVKAQAYPNILVKVGFNDPRVNYWEGTKWVAKMRALKTDKNTIILKVNMGQGHMGATGRYARLKEAAFDYAYVLNQSGITK